MKRIQIVAILLVIMMGVFSACSKKEFVIKGKFSGVDFNKVSLVPMLDYKVIATSDIDNNGNFRITVKGVKEGEYVLKFTDNENVHVYIGKSGDLSLDIKYRDYVFDVKYSGDFADESSYIYNVRVLQDDLISSFMTEMMSMEVKELESAFLILENDLKKVLSDNRTKNEALSILYENLIKYKIANIKLQYETLKRESSESKKYVLPIGFNDYKKSIKIDDYKLVEYSEYIEFIRIFFRVDIINNLIKEKGKYTVSEYCESYLTEFKEKVVPQRAKDIVIYTGFTHFMQELVKEDAEATVKMGISHMSNRKFKRKLDSIYSRCKSTEYKLSPGSVPPSWSAKDITGKKYTLESFKGHYVFVELWATWCAPCVQELPYFETLASDLRSKNLNFVSISIDSNFGEWEKFISVRNSEVIQLINTNSFKAKFMTDYEINGVPRFMLFDQLGKVVNTNMPRPSDPKCREILESVL